MRRVKDLPLFMKRVCPECGGSADNANWVWRCGSCKLSWETKEPRDGRPYRIAYRRAGGRWGEVPGGTMMVWREKSEP